MLKEVRTVLLCQIGDISSMNKVNVLAQNRRISLPSTERTNIVNRRVGCLQWLESRSLGSAKWSGHPLRYDSYYNEEMIL